MWINLTASRVRIIYTAHDIVVGYQAEYASIYPRGAKDISECICNDRKKISLKKFLFLKKMAVLSVCANWA